MRQVLESCDLPCYADNSVFPLFSFILLSSDSLAYKVLILQNLVPIFLMTFGTNM